MILYDCMNFFALRLNCINNNSLLCLTACDIVERY